MKLNEAPDDLLIQAYIKVRDDLSAKEAEMKAALAPLKDKLDKIETEMLRRFNERGVESVRTKFGTAYKNTRASVSVADWDAFFNGFVLPNKAWDFINHAANKSSIQQYKEEHNELPPGINYSEVLTVGFRRA